MNVACQLPQPLTPKNPPSVTRKPNPLYAETRIFPLVLLLD